ncbi:MAG: hypothetical protein JXK16_13120 [Thiotrichales bacterium]|nr:hypothetical protein [Thiotrichales bacterium]
MPENKRKFFRMNVELPVFIWAVPESVSEMSVPSKSNAAFQRHQSQLNHLFLDEKHLRNGAINLFKGVNQRVDFLVWLLDYLIQGKDPRQSKDFYPKLDQDRLISMPEGNGKSSVFPLIHALYYRVDELILSLLAAVEQSYDGQVFLFTRPLYAPFSGERYLHNLAALADKGNWLAQVLQNLIFKLNIYEQAYTDLKARFGDLSYPEHWPIRGLNLSTGGLAIEGEDEFAADGSFYVLMQLPQAIVAAQARIVGRLPIGTSVSSQQSEKPKSRYRVSFEFENVAPGQQALITQFVIEQELVSAHPELK